MNLYYLLAELIVDMIALILGITLIIQKTDNFPKFYWGIIAALIGAVFIWENIGWVIIRSENPVYEFTDMLNIEKMLKFYVLASVVALYPLASLRPGYLTHFRVVTYLLTPIVVTTIGISYLCFNGTITPLSSIDHLIGSLDQRDVKLRIIIFILTVTTPLLYFICPLINNKGQRKISRMMYFFIGFMFLLLSIYILFTLYICDIFFNGFGIISITFSIFFSIQYLRTESPLSAYVDSKTQIRTDNPQKTGTRTPPHTVSSPLYQTISNYLEETHAYINPAYKLEDLARHLKERDSAISTAIKEGGYSGFREYINHLRLEHFKYQVSQNSDRTVKELMYMCGFTSRTTFYRLYADRYNETPTEFIEKQKSKE